ncbi:hypothetical protein M0811_03763 [Anaeramoeba ignava]|uniref:PH domain-containing protein n=1 Tax=Anaeramoeba ignava TaxID=1746090 RepID=A0A9Q0RIZ2_ANAIG|nr:hypothetical protein M0811_03763 [Anaeramoeba ignava]
MDLFKNAENLRVDIEIVKNDKKRYFQFREVPGVERYGSAVVLYSSNIPKRIEFWYKNWRIAKVNISQKHLVPAKNATEFPRLSGFLRKQGGRHKSIKRRWFLLKDSTLSYYKKENQKEPIDSIDLSKIQFISKTNEPNTFHLYTQYRTYVCMTENEEELELWFSIIKSVLKLRKHVQNNYKTIDNFYGNPESSVDGITEKNYKTITGISGHGLFLYFAKNYLVNSMIKLLKLGFIRKQDLEYLKYSNMLLNWKDPELLKLFIQLNFSREIDIDIITLNHWITYFQENEPKLIDISNQENFPFQDEDGDKFKSENMKNIDYVYQLSQNWIPSQKQTKTPQNQLKIPVIFSFNNADEVISRDYRLLHQTVDDCDKIRDKINSTLKANSMINSQLQEILKSNREKKSQYDKSREQIKKENELLNALISEWENQKNRLDEKKKEIEDQKIQLTHDFSDLKSKEKDRIEELNQELQEIKDQIKKLNQEISQEQQHLAPKQKLFQKNQEIKKDRKSKLSELAKKLEKSNNQHKAIQDEISKLIQDTNSQQDRVFEINKAKIAVNENLIQKESLLNQQMEEILKQEKEISSLTKQLEDTVLALSNAQKDSLSHQEDTEKNQLRFQEINSKIEMNQKLLQQEEVLQSQIQNLISSLENNENPNENELNQILEQLSQYENQQDKEIEEINLQNSQLESQNLELNQKIEACNKEYSSISTENRKSDIKRITITKQLKTDHQKFVNETKQIQDSYSKTKENLQSVCDVLKQEAFRLKNEKEMQPISNINKDQENQNAKNDNSSNETIALIISDFVNAISALQSIFVKYQKSTNFETRNKEIQEIVENDFALKIINIFSIGLRSNKTTIWKLLGAIYQEIKQKNESNHFESKFIEYYQFFDNLKKYQRKKADDLKFQVFIQRCLNKKCISQFFELVYQFRQVLLDEFYLEEEEMKVTSRIVLVFQQMKKLSQYNFDLKEEVK